MKAREFYRRYEREFLAAAAFLFFAIAYPLINFMSIGRDAAVLLHPLDEMFPFLPFMILVYLSAFVMPLVIYFVIKDIASFRRAVSAFFLVMVVAYAVFIIYPVEVIFRPDLSTTVFSRLFHAYYAICPPYNAFPSMHVCFPFLTSFVMFRHDRKYWWLFIWAGLIAASTVLIKIHYLVDVMAGLALALLAYLLVLRKD